MRVFVSIEDTISRAVAERLLSECCPAGTTLQELGKAHGGFGYIRKNIGKFYNLAQTAPVLIITDLDNAVCPPSLRAEWLTSAGISEPLPPNMIFCIAQKEIEAWLLADTAGIANFLGISQARLTPDIENSIAHPKEYLVNLAKYSTKKQIKLDLLPAKRSDAATGLNYNYRLSQFASDDWSIQTASVNSLSLRRTISKLSLLNP